MMSKQEAAKSVTTGQMAERGGLTVLRFVYAEVRFA
jgi:hypothetical protein